MDNLGKELAINLEAVKKHGLKESPVVEIIAKLIDKYDIKDFALMNELVEGLNATSLKSKDDLRNIELTPQSILDAEIAEKVMKPSVENIRLELFNTEATPFSDIAGATNWLAQYVADESEKFPNEDDITRGIARESIQIGEMLFVLRPNDTITRLNTIAEQIQRYTGATLGSALWHILLGKRLIIPSFRYRWIVYRSRLEDGKTEVEAVDLVISSPLSFKQMRKLHKDMRNMFGRTKKKELNEKDLELYRLIQLRGAIPNKGKVKYWVDITKAWNEEHGLEYTTWKGIKRRYDLLQKRLKQRNQLILDN